MVNLKNKLNFSLLSYLIILIFKSTLQFQISTTCVKDLIYDNIDFTCLPCEVNTVPNTNSKEYFYLCCFLIL